MTEPYFELLVKSVLPYQYVWEDMMKSGYFPLNDRQLDLVVLYLKKQSIENMNLNCNKEVFQNQISLILIQLSEPGRVIAAWRHRQKSMFAKALDLPVNKIKASPSLIYELSLLGKTTGEILRKYSEEELLELKYWNQSFTMIYELRKFLNANQCEIALIRTKQERLNLLKPRIPKYNLDWIFNELQIEVVSPESFP